MTQFFIQNPNSDTGFIASLEEALDCAYYALADKAHDLVITVLSPFVE